MEVNLKRLMLLACAALVLDVNAVGVKCVSEKVSLSVVQEAKEYNSWPMIRAVGDRIVCTYGRGSGHTVEGARGAYARTSTDCGLTWSPEVCIVNDPGVCEGVEGIGRDSTGAVLCWMNCRLRRKGHILHDLYRTRDGVAYEKIAAPDLSPEPIQITGIFSVPGVGLMSLWFSGNYRSAEPCNSWGTLVSKDDGRTWVQRTVESGLPKSEWPTEQSAVHLGGGRILVIGRAESGAKRQFQLTSLDGGATWRKAGTNIRDVQESTPSLVYDSKNGLVANYYYHRGARKLKRRVVDAGFIFDRPNDWPPPEVLAEGSETRACDAGNVNVMEYRGRHLATFYSGTERDCAVYVVSIPVPSAAATAAAALEIGGWKGETVSFLFDAASEAGGVSVSGKVCGNLAQSSGGWQLPLYAIVGTAAVGAALFLALWNARASGYGEEAGV